MFRTNADYQAALSKVIATSERDYQIYSDWVSGVPQRQAAALRGISANRVSQIIARHLRYYDGNVGRSFYQCVRRMNEDRPILYEIVEPTTADRCLVYSVVVVDQKFLEDSWLRAQVGKEFGCGPLAGPLRKAPVATLATHYLKSILE